MEKKTLEKIAIVVTAINIIFSFCRLIETIFGENNHEKD